MKIIKNFKILFLWIFRFDHISRVFHLFWCFTLGSILSIFESYWAFFCLNHLVTLNRFSSIYKKNIVWVELTLDMFLAPVDVMHILPILCHDGFTHALLFVLSNFFNYINSLDGLIPFSNCFYLKLQSRKKLRERALPLLLQRENQWNRNQSSWRDKSQNYN